MAMRVTNWALLACVLLAPPYLYVEGISILPTRAAASGSSSTSLAATQTDSLAWVQEAGIKSQKVAAVGSVRATKKAPVYGNLITVAKTGAADFQTVQAAVNAVPSDNYQRVIIQIAAGTYKEKVNIPRDKPTISFIGAGAAITNIIWHDTATSAGSTFRSATVTVNSDGFIAHNISFTNSAPPPPSGAVGRQAVALRISGDKASFYSCNFYGAQDTLYDHQGRHYFKNCFIQGSHDFVFGHGLSYYDGCELHSIATTSGSVTAQNREVRNDNTGFSFVNCTITGSGRIYLGRAWGPYSRVVFIYTYMEDIIVPSGWNNFYSSRNERTAFYGEYQCSGPGANSVSRVPWSHQLSDAQAAPFKTLSFIDGESWLQA